MFFHVYHNISGSCSARGVLPCRSDVNQSWHLVKSMYFRSVTHAGPRGGSGVPHCPAVSTKGEIDPLSPIAVASAGAQAAALPFSPLRAEDGGSPIIGGDDWPVVTTRQRLIGDFEAVCACCLCS